MISSDFKQQAVSYLQELIRINTSNPPGNEKLAIDFIASILDEEKIDYTIVGKDPNRPNLVAKIPGDGSLKPLLLTSHVDVVLANPDEWKYPPFSGEIHEDCIWGRGAIDMKQMTIMELICFVFIHQQKIPLKRDLILACVSDEEAGCEYGSQYLVENHPELIQAEYALNEVGGFSLYQNEQTFYPIGVAEKGVCWLKINLKGQAGHGSIPHDDQAIVKLSKIISELDQKFLSYSLAHSMKGFIDGLASSFKFPQSKILKSLKNSSLANFLFQNILPKNKQTKSFYALLHNTATVTKINAGKKINVIPSKAELEIDGRIIPGHTVNSFLKDLKGILGENIDLEIIKAWDPVEVTENSDLYNQICTSLKKYDPKAITIPYLIPGFTDAAWYSKLGIKTYGFAPVKLPPDIVFSDLFHGPNERIPVEGFLFGIDVFYDVIYEFCRG
jgi:acetylornithine deacetylase/succinyl-diaminopimelate desuccinylase-like protein